MGWFSNPARREARLERRAAKVESKLAEVRKSIPSSVQAAQLAPKFDQPGKSTAVALSELREFVIQLDTKQQAQIDAIDADIGRLASKNKAMKGGGGGLGGGDMSPLLLVLLLGGLGGSSTTTTNNNSTLLLVLLLAGGGGDDDGGMGALGLILLLSIL